MHKTVSYRSEICLNKASLCSYFDTAILLDHPQIITVVEEISVLFGYAVPSVFGGLVCAKSSGW